MTAGTIRPNSVPSIAQEASAAYGSANIKAAKDELKKLRRDMIRLSRENGLRLASAVGPLLVGIVVSSNGTASVFLMFGVTAIAGALAATRMIETRARQLEEIAT